ncbi:MAG: DUF1722 domain-containing protein [Gammaproteobacteria bacterium]|nr:DUF1722 domain-containing protein [Gammaproteobacteria bacterium]
MRIWDINPGYLNRQSLLGEHRELHGLVSIMVNGKKGYSRHPETIRWIGFGWAIRQRHRALASEMALRGYTDKSPLRTRSNKGKWPAIYIDAPHIQFELLKEKYKDKEGGRIQLPENAQQLWRHHKYSVLARDQQTYKEIGRNVSSGELPFEELAMILVELLRKPPGAEGIRNALQHMWGYISESKSNANKKVAQLPPGEMLRQIQRQASIRKEPYLNGSTALSELMAWI